MCVWNILLEQERRILQTKSIGKKETRLGEIHEIVLGGWGALRALAVHPNIGFAKLFLYDGRMEHMQRKSPYTSWVQTSKPWLPPRL